MDIKRTFFDEVKIFNEIRTRKPKKICISAPDGLMMYLEDISTRITKEFGIDVFIMGDSCYGSCDTTNFEAKRIGAELAFNIGHTISFEKLGDRTIMIDAFDDISFDSVTEKCIEMFRGKTISLITDSQHLHQIKPVKDTLVENGVDVKIGKGQGQLNDGQVFGCEFYPAMETVDIVDVNVFLGQSDFHAAGIAMATNKPTYILDPYFNEIREVTDLAKKLQKQSTLAIYKAAEAETFGIIIGLKEGQLSKLTALKFKKELEDQGKTVHLFALTDITNERMKNLKGIDAFIQVACPRISTDNRFDKPVLSTPQATALVKVLRKENIDEYFQIKHWL